LCFLFKFEDRVQAGKPPNMMAKTVTGKPEDPKGKPLASIPVFTRAVLSVFHVDTGLVVEPD